MLLFPSQSSIVYQKGKNMEIGAENLILLLFRSDLKQTKKVLNEIASENDLLKLAIGKARYGIPPARVSDEERERINRLQMENDELKSEVRLFPDKVVKRLFCCNETFL